MKKCPACNRELKPKVVPLDDRGSVEIDYCLSCGGVWFDQGEAEDISYEGVSDLVSDLGFKKHISVSGPCPVCGSLLKPLKSQNIPADIHSWHCPSCRGSFFSSSEFLKYKSAQKNKISYFKSFKLPFSRHSLMITGVALALLAGLGAMTYITQNYQDNRVRAERLIGRPFVTQLSQTSATLSFTTRKPLKTKLRLSAPFIAQERELSVSNTPATLHQITLEKLKADSEYSYRIVVAQDSGGEVVSEEFSFTTP